MEIIIESLDEYVKKIIELDSSLTRNFKENEHLLFRGQGNKEFELLPGIARGRSSSCDISILDEERNMIDLAKLKRPDIFRNDMDPIELLALLQHYGIPTRLLDITENALVALYFACDSEKEKDAEVIVFKNDEKDISNYPILNAIADSYRFSNSTIHDLRLFFEDVIEQPYFLEQRNSVKKMSELESVNWIVECCKSPFFIYAPIKTQRQLMQRGRYILFHNKIEENEHSKYFTKLIEPIEKNNPSIVARLIIPRKLKNSFSEQLALFGITTDFLFSDNVDVTCKSIKNMFSNNH